MRASLRATSAALMRLLGPDGVSGYTLHAIDRLAADVGVVERFAGRWGVQGLADELVGPVQLCALLLSNRVRGGLCGFGVGGRVVGGKSRGGLLSSALLFLAARDCTTCATPPNPTPKPQTRNAAARRGARR